MSNKFEPYLSIVVTARNDNHGGDLLHRVRLFLQNLDLQSTIYKLPLELIIVEWNPPAGKERLREVLPQLPVNVFLNIRYIEVPNNLHLKYQYAEILPLFQMLAKNVGVRRASAPFILCTNIDILFSNSLMEYLAQKKLVPKKLYRANRHDIQIKNIDEVTDTAEILHQAAEITIRKNFKSHSYDNINQTSLNRIYLPESLLTSDRSFDKHLGMVYTNASGDFQLLDRDSWFMLRGYAEFETYSMHIDSMFEYKVKLAGIEEITLPDHMITFHIEHGSGFTPESSKDGSFQKKYNKSGMQEMENMRQLAWQMHYAGEITHFNDQDWGLASKILPEHTANERLGFTILFCPKAFINEYKQMQRNAIISWKNLEPCPEIIMLGEEEGCKEVAAEFGLKHIPEIEVNQYGTPLIPSLFTEGQNLSSNAIIVYINSDIILFPAFVENIRQILNHNPGDFLMIGERHDMDVYEVLNPESTYKDITAQLEELERRSQTDSRGHGKRGIDFFVFRRGMFTDIPPFALGRLVWDNWLCWDALQQQIPVIEAADEISALHQNHTYNYNGNNRQTIRNGEEAKQNLDLAFGRCRCRHIGNSQFVLKHNQILWRHNNEEIADLTTLPKLTPTLEGVYNLTPEDFAKSTEAVFAVGDNYYINKEYHNALRVYHRLALDLENGDAMVNLADMFARGLGVEPDYRIAAYWLRRLSKLPAINGNNCYSLIFEKQPGGINPALYWQKRLCEDTSDLPAYMLALIFTFGLAVTRDLPYVIKMLEHLNREDFIIASSILYEELRISGDYKEKELIFEYLDSKRKILEGPIEPWLLLTLTTFPDRLIESDLIEIVNYFLNTKQSHKLIDICIRRMVGRDTAYQKSLKLLYLAEAQGCIECSAVLKELATTIFWRKDNIN